MLERKLGPDTISVFIFRNSEDREGLNPDVKVKIQAILYSITNTNTKEFLDKLFLTIRKQLRTLNNK